MGVQTFTCACDLLTQPHMSLRVPMGSALTPTLPCGTVSPQGPSLGCPGPPTMGGAHPCIPALQQGASFSLLE